MIDLEIDKVAEKNENAPVQEDMNELLKVRRDKLAAFREMGVAPFGHRFEVSHHNARILEQYAGLEGEAESEEEVSIAGRLMAIRGHAGRPPYCKTRSWQGKLFCFDGPYQPYTDLLQAGCFG